jgi:hypothetical protein
LAPGATSCVPSPPLPRRRLLSQRPLVATEPDTEAGDRLLTLAHATGSRAAPAARDDAEVYCFCNRTDSVEFGFMLQCDTCLAWFHGPCVGFTKEQAETWSSFECAGCEKWGLRMRAKRAVSAAAAEVLPPPAKRARGRL